MSEEIDYPARVARGIALLDEKWPNWATEIDLERLDIQQPYRCMTAQYSTVHGGDGDWRDGMGMLNLSSCEYREHGFNGEENASGRVPDAAYDALNGLWKAEIERRRAAAQSAPAEPEASA